ncbi:MAG TPA: NADPH-dependent assimilatory sulfite reductase hemoprotein subunit [Acidobacteriota bacterium]|jgi:sulfite reductase beta subunit-like hemoprotein|nr:NADPH-dependent assimilatory sulfite reductase hemoprotein subunit [Acidobacteriota bacterium]
MSGKLSKVETIKENSRGLRGTIAEELKLETTHFAKETTHLLKFHGIYQQEDRDQRVQRKEIGQEKAYQFMVRTKLPGGALTAEQWIVLNRISEFFGDGTLRITSRQDVQFHGVGKSNLQNAIQMLNSGMVTTYGACGDGTRNVIACPVSDLKKGGWFDARHWAALISKHLSFRSTAYYEIWLDGERLKTDAVEDEPLYGKTYLPRKFKIGIALPDDNCVDVFTNDVGLIAIPDASHSGLAGFNVLAGGGMGSTNGQVQTFPRLADPVAFVPPEGLIDTITRLTDIYRDFGDRADRKRARLKYVMEQLGVKRFRQELESRLGATLEMPRRINIGQNLAHLGWHPEQRPGFFYLGVFVENGRIRDNPGSALKTGLSTVIERFRPAIRLSPTQDIILAHIREENRREVEQILSDHGVALAEQISNLRRQSLACPALPTCGLALAEAERFLPSLIDALEVLGFGDEQVKIRMSGCPNACSRPPVAELAFMGSSKDLYNVYVGGNLEGTRLAALLYENVSSDGLADTSAALLAGWRQHRQDQERFGDFCMRVGNDRLRNLEQERYEEVQALSR